MTSHSVAGTKGSGTNKFSLSLFLDDNPWKSYTEQTATYNAGTLPCDGTRTKERGDQEVGTKKGNASAQAWSPPHPRSCEPCFPFYGDLPSHKDRHHIEKVNRS